ncbi:hypothetical protein OS493_030970 [Desmophyllum pertusum]|uniref:MACPF domain-containing protein n=1 Tax=Desmophyllum pertusum TaxID=174260 RepID=A0A9X0D297_9CNID|nr:hypothetical protein OS493_030970 [Desmophyllum pertusum]
MFGPLVLFIFLTVTFRGSCEVPPSAETVELGKAVNLRGVNLLDDFQQRERAIFESLPSKCFLSETKNIQSSRKFFEYYANSKSFYKSLGTQSGLSVSLQSSYTLSATLNVATKSTSSKESKVSGMSLNVLASTKKILVRKGCLLGDESSVTLKEEFVRKLEQLPVTIKKPWLENAWQPYRTFIRNYGSHVVSSVTRGTSFKLMTFAASSKSYSERDFQVKACAAFAGPTAAGKLDVAGCTEITSEEKSRESQMSTSIKVFIRGGDPQTSNKLLHQNTRSNELISQLMNDATDYAASIEHTFTSMWDILRSRYDIGSPNHVRAINLENYFIGYLSYGCRLVESGGVKLQKFDRTEGSTENSPRFECSLAKEGCHGEDDCHYKGYPGIWCSCRGSSCVRYKSVEQGGVRKQTAYANNKEDWAWQGCDWDAAVQGTPNHGAHLKAKDPGQSDPTEMKGKKI